MGDVHMMWRISVTPLVGLSLVVFPNHSHYFSFLHRLRFHIDVVFPLHPWATEVLLLSERTDPEAGVQKEENPFVSALVQCLISVFSWTNPWHLGSDLNQWLKKGFSYGRQPIEIENQTQNSTSLHCCAGSIKLLKLSRRDWDQY